MADPFMGSNTGFLPPAPGGGASVGATVASDVGSAAPSAGVSAEASRVDHVHEVLHRYSVGSWRIANQAADATNTPPRATGIGNVWVAHRACRVVGWSYSLSATGTAAVVTSGTLSINGIRTPANGGAADAAVLIKQITSSDLTNAGGTTANVITLAVGDCIAVQLVSVALAPTTLDPAVELEIEETSAA